VRQDDLPDDQRLVDADCDDSSVRGVEYGTLNRLCMPVQLEDVLACLHAPNRGRLVLASCDKEVVTVVGPVDADNLLELCRDLEQAAKLEVRRVGQRPDAHAAIFTKAGDFFAGSREFDYPDLVFVPREGRDAFRRDRVLPALVIAEQ